MLKNENFIKFNFFKKLEDEIKFYWNNRANINEYSDKSAEAINNCITKRTMKEKIYNILRKNIETNKY